ncbi:MAG: NFACT RNA binding domain-containing protein [Myxococcota bacterium]
MARTLRRARKRLLRKEGAIAADAARAEKVPALRHEAELLTAHLGDYVPGADALEVLDWTDTPPTPRVLSIDPSRGAQAQAESLFKQARRYARGAELARRRRDATRAEIAALERLLDRVEAAPAADAQGALEEEAATAGWWAPGESSRRRAAGARVSGKRRSYRTFATSEGGVVLVGRSATDNDELTLRVARPHDLWLHARGVRGAHVIVPLGKRDVCPPERLVDAATLAAHFSEAAGDAVVEVQYTPRRHVHKRKGLPPGAVHVSREKVLILRYEEERARALVAREHRT